MSSLSVAPAPILFQSFEDAGRFIPGFNDAEERCLYVGGKYDMSDTDTIPAPINTHKAIVNEATGEISQISTRQYQILQHRDFFAMVLSSLEKAGLSGSGKYVPFGDGDKWKMQVLFDNIKVYEPGMGQNLQVGAEFVNSYNATTSASGRAFYMRISCTNQMTIKNLIPGVDFSKNHIARNQEDLLISASEKIEDYVDRLLENCTQIEEAIQVAIDTTFSIEEIQIVPTIENIVGTRKHAEGIANLVRPGVVSRWDLYNSITDYASHNDLTPSVEERLLGLAERKVLNSKTPLLILDAPLA